MASSLSLAEAYTKNVLSGDRLSQIRTSLPRHIAPERFERNFYAVVTEPNNEWLLKCNPEDVFREIAKAASSGLLLEPVYGEAYLVKKWTPKGDVPQMRVGYRGLIKLARQGNAHIANIYAIEICKNDKFIWRQGTSPSLEHEPTLDDRGPVIGYYAVVTFDDGSPADFEVMSMAEIHRIRERSDGWKAYKDGKIKTTPWATDEAEMSRKTVLRRLLKRQSLSPDIAVAVERDEDAAIAEPVDITPAPEASAAPKRKSSKLDAVAAPTTAEAPVVIEQSPQPEYQPDSVVQVWIDGYNGATSAEGIEKIETGARAAHKHKPFSPEAVAALKAARASATERLASVTTGENGQ